MRRQQEATTTDPDGVAIVDGYRDNVLLWSRNGNNDIVNTRYDGKLQKNLVVDPKGNQEESTFDPAGNPAHADRAGAVQLHRRPASSTTAAT